VPVIRGAVLRRLSDRSARATGSTIRPGSPELESDVPRNTCTPATRLSTFILADCEQRSCDCYPVIPRGVASPFFPLARPPPLASHCIFCSHLLWGLPCMHCGPMTDTSTCFEPTSHHFGYIQIIDCPDSLIVRGRSGRPRPAHTQLTPASGFYIVHGSQQPIMHVHCSEGRQNSNYRGNIRAPTALRSQESSILTVVKQTFKFVDIASLAAGATFMLLCTSVG